MVAEIEIRLSGGKNNQDPKASVGGNRSDTLVVTDVLQNLFDDIKRNEALVGRTEYRLIYVWNNSGTPATGTVIRVLTNPPISEISIGLAPEGKGDGRTTGVGETLVTEDQTPIGVKFFGEDIESSDGPFSSVTLPLGFIEAGESVPVWIKRVAEKGIEQIISLTIEIEHDSVTLPGEDVDDGSAIGELLNVTKQTTGTFLIDVAKIDFADMGSP